MKGYMYFFCSVIHYTILCMHCIIIGVHVMTSPRRANAGSIREFMVVSERDLW